MRPFNLTLEQIQKFSLKDSDQKIVFPRSGVKEFKRLNQFLSEMTKKVQSDYRSLKEFSENASHEFQTPIAVIQSKLELLLGDESLTEQQIEQVSYIQNAIRRLSNLSNSLALLTKIDNNEFSNVSELDLSEILSGMLEEFRELMDLKQIETETDLSSGVKLEADKVLVEILLTNLINNAIRHNWEEGKIKLSLTNASLLISNSGPELSIKPDDLFRRFKKSNQSAQSLGLGLAIVKKICDFYGYEIKYELKEGFHTIQIDF